MIDDGTGVPDGSPPADGRTPDGHSLTDRAAEPHAAVRHLPRFDGYPTGSAGR